jgi:hypothetical protein
MSQSPRHDNRLLALRAAGQDATDFEMTDDQVRHFMMLRDEGFADDEIAGQLAIEPEIVEALVKADEAQKVAHRIATGELAMYPPPEPGEAVADGRSGSFGVPVAVMIVVLVGVIVYAALR